MCAVQLKRDMLSRFHRSAVNQGVSRMVSESSMAAQLGAVVTL